MHARLGARNQRGAHMKSARPFPHGGPRDQFIADNHAAGAPIHGPGLDCGQREVAGSSGAAPAAGKWIRRRHRHRPRETRPHCSRRPPCWSGSAGEGLYWRRLISIPCIVPGGALVATGRVGFFMARLNRTSTAEAGRCQ